MGDIRGERLVQRSEPTVMDQQEAFYHRIFEREIQAHLTQHRIQGLKACTPLCLGDMFERGWHAKALWVQGMLA
jgi:hypothetical protein